MARVTTGGYRHSVLSVTTRRRGVATVVRYSLLDAFGGYGPITAAQLQGLPESDYAVRVAGLIAHAEAREAGFRYAPAVLNTPSGTVGDAHSPAGLACEAVSEPPPEPDPLEPFIVTPSWTLVREDASQRVVRMFAHPSRPITRQEGSVTVRLEQVSNNGSHAFDFIFSYGGTPYYSTSDRHFFKQYAASFAVLEGPGYTVGEPGRVIINP